MRPSRSFRSPSFRSLPVTAVPIYTRILDPVTPGSSVLPEREQADEPSRGSPCEPLGTGGPRPTVFRRRPNRPLLRIAGTTGFFHRPNLGVPIDSGADVACTGSGDAARVFSLERENTLTLNVPIYPPRRCTLSWWGGLVPRRIFPDGEANAPVPFRGQLKLNSHLGGNDISHSSSCLWEWGFRVSGAASVSCC